MLAHATFNPRVRNGFISGASKEWEVINQGQEAAPSPTSDRLSKKQQQRLPAPGMEEFIRGSMWEGEEVRGADR